jgi:hypothetical protein
LISREKRLSYRVAPGAILSCIHGDGCVIFLAINSAVDSFLSLKLVADLPDGVLSAVGKADDSYDVAPCSQRILFIASRSGRRSNATELNFRYLSSGVKIQGKPKGSEETTKVQTIRGSISLSPEGNLLVGSIDPSSVRSKASGSIDTFLWIPQLGSPV